MSLVTIYKNITNGPPTLLEYLCTHLKKFPQCYPPELKSNTDYHRRHVVITLKTDALLMTLE